MWIRSLKTTYSIETAFDLYTKGPGIDIKLHDLVFIPKLPDLGNGGSRAGAKNFPQLFVLIRRNHFIDLYVPFFNGQSHLFEQCNRRIPRNSGQDGF